MPQPDRADVLCEKRATTRGTRLVILLILVLVGAAVTVYLGRNELRAVTRWGFVLSGLGVLALPCVFLIANYLVLVLGAATLAYGVAVLIGCLVVTRCGRNARI